MRADYIAVISVLKTMNNSLSAKSPSTSEIYIYESI